MSNGPPLITPTCPTCGARYRRRFNSGAGGWFRDCECADEPPSISMWINAPVCDDCWAEREGDRVPVRMREPETEACHYCGRDTTSGIYQRAEARRG